VAVENGKVDVWPALESQGKGTGQHFHVKVDPLNEMKNFCRCHFWGYGRSDMVPLCGTIWSGAFPVKTEYGVHMFRQLETDIRKRFEIGPWTI